VADKELLGLVKEGGQKTLTIAPECNEGLRFKIGKPIRDKAYFKFVEWAAGLGFEKLKCYFMIGIPGQKDNDIDQMIELIIKIRRIFSNSYISINPFVPKPGTELEKHIFDIKEIKRQGKALKKALGSKGIDFKLPSAKAAERQWRLAHKK